MVGLDLLAIGVYVMCLRPFADARSGDVRCASYYRFRQLLTPAQPRGGGKRWLVPTTQQISDALDRLAAAGLIEVFREISRRERVLQIRVVRRFGVVSSDSVGRGVRRKARRLETRMDAGFPA